VSGRVENLQAGGRRFDSSTAHHCTPAHNPIIHMRQVFKACSIPTLHLILFWTLFQAFTAFAQAHRIEGIVRDQMGAFVVGARVELRAGKHSASATTDLSGKFIFDSVPEVPATIFVQAKGFADLQQGWTPQPAPLEIVLSPATENVQIVVTATRLASRIEHVAASTVALTDDDMNATAALLPDDKLRQIPGFTIFRRGSSRTVNPTSQGVSLNGLGASGSSRALVLQDGVPLNDAFGGWIYWSQIPQQELSSVEVVRGGVSSLYGSNALGGVVQFLSRPVQNPEISLETSYGSERTPNLEFWGGTRFSAWDGSLAADLFHTDGYVLVPVEDRGTIDTAANSEHATVKLTLGRHFGEQTRIFGRGAFFTEGRHNGTPIQINDTQTGQGILGADSEWKPVGTISARLYGDVQRYNQNFSSITSDRSCESLTDMQHVPSQRLGGSGFWSRSAGGQQNLVAGFDSQEVIGSSHEDLFLSTGTCPSVVPNGTSIAGGRQRTIGVYGEDILHLTSRWILTLGGRLDHWRNFDAQALRFPATGAPILTPFVERSENAFSPRASLLRQLSRNVALTASVYRAFRSPTLNELYRSFRLGNVLTQANSDLRAERLTGAEAGGNVFLFDRKLNLRGTFFWSDIVNPIANVTLSSTPSLIMRQRQNLGRTRSRGVVLDAVFRISDVVELAGGYQFVDSTVVSFPANTALQGLRVPQVPRHQFTLQARYWKPSQLMLSVQGRFAGAQFDDDQNLLKLDRYFTVDLFAGRSIGHGVDAFVAIENLINQRYTVSLSPIPTLGPPFLARAGVRFNFPARR
jgi:outer membrane receptor protein involved in Fe transport